MQNSGSEFSEKSSIQIKRTSKVLLEHKAVEDNQSMDI